MNEQIQGLTITNVDKNEALYSFKKELKTLLERAESVFSPAPEGTSAIVKIPGDDKHCLALIKTECAVVPFVFKRSENGWEIKTELPYDVVKASGKALCDKIGFMADHIGTVVVQQAKYNAFVKTAYQDFKNEYGAKLFFSKTPYAYNEENIIKLAKALKHPNMSEMNYRTGENIPVTFNHSVRVAGIAVEMAKKLGLSKEEQTILRHAALVHDIGKTDIRRTLLMKSGSYTNEERLEMAAHASRSEDILRRSFSSIPEVIVRLAKYHHDGSRAAKLCEMTSRESMLHEVLCCADQIEALTSPERTYKPGFDINRAIQFIKQDPAKRVSEKIVECGRDVVHEMELSFEYDRNGCIDFSRRNPELQNLIENGPAFKDNDYALERGRTTTAKNILEKTVGMAKWVDRKYPPDPREVSELKSEADRMLSKCTWTDLYDSGLIQQLSYGENSAMNYVVNSAIRMKDYYIQNKDFINIKAEDMISIERSAQKRVSGLDKKIEEATRLAAERKKLKSPAGGGDTIDMAI